MNFKEDTVLKTILLGVKQSQPHAQLSLYIDCVSYGNIATVKTLRDIYMNMRNPQILFVSKQIQYHSLYNFFRMEDNVKVLQVPSRYHDNRKIKISSGFFFVKNYDKIFIYMSL